MCSLRCSVICSVAWASDTALADMSSHRQFNGGAVRPEREVVGARGGRERGTSAGKLR